MFHFSKVPAAFVCRAADLGVDLDVAHHQSFLPRDRLEYQPTFDALHRFGAEIFADLVPVEIRLLHIDSL